MEKILTIDGRQVKFKSTGAFLLRYKAQFRRDAFKDILKMKDLVSGRDGGACNNPNCAYCIDGACKKPKNIEAIDLEVFYNLVWTLAKIADPNIPPPLEWLDGFSEFPLIDIMPEVIDMMINCLTTTVSSKKK